MWQPWVRDADALAETWVARLETEEADPDAPLWTSPLDARAFSAGHRTGDAGTLGGVSGRQAFAPQDGTAATWRLIDPRARADDAVVDEAETAAGEPVEVFATDGGPFVLECQPEGDDPSRTLVSVPYMVVVEAHREHMAPVLGQLLPDDDGAQGDLWEAVLRTADRVAAHVLRPLNVRLVWAPEGNEGGPLEQDGGEDEDDGGEDDDDDGGLPAPPEWATPGDTTLDEREGRVLARHDGDDEIPGLRHLLVDRPRDPQQPGPTLDAWEERLDALGVPLPRQAWRLHQWEHDLIMQGNTPAWGYRGGLEHARVAVVADGLGVLNALGAAVGDGGADTAADEALAALAAALDGVAADGAAPVAHQRFAEIAGRRLGVFLARAACRLAGLIGDGEVGVPTIDPDTGLADAGDPALTDLLDPQPADPVRDLLGLHRPGGDRDDAHLAADLAQQDGAGDAGAWFDLVDHYAAVWEVDDDRTTAYDVLAGLVEPERLKDAQLAAPLPAPYGRHALQIGDRDIDPDGGEDARYGGADGDDIDERATAIADARADLRRIGITLHEAEPDDDYRGVSHAIRDERHYGYRRWAWDDDTIWDGVAGDTPNGFNGYPARGEDETPAAYRVRLEASVGFRQRRHVKRGHTDWVVREFQIACGYPRTVVERLDASSEYKERLRVAAQADDDGGDGGGGGEVEPNDAVDGSLSLRDALELRRWVLGRRRYPIVVEARRGNGWGTIDHENLMASDGIPDNSPRMFVTDLSGRHPREALARHDDDDDDDNGLVDLGDYTRGDWEGPRSAPQHARSRFRLATTFSDRGWVYDTALLDDDEDGQEGEDGQDDEDGQDGGNGQDEVERQQRRRTQSAFRLIAAIAHAETGGYYDGFNAWDNGIFSYPLFHFTLGRGTGDPAQMAGFVEWLQNADDDMIEGATDDAEQAQALRGRMHRAFRLAFGDFGVGAGAPQGNYRDGFLTLRGLQVVPRADGEGDIDMTVEWPGADTAVGDRQRALYQSYCQWFRTWPWFTRWAQALRADEELCRLTLAHSVHVAALRITDAVHDRLSSERAAAAYLRLFVYRPRLATDTFDALPGAGTAEELLRAMLVELAPDLNANSTDNQVFNTTCDANTTSCRAANSIRAFLGRDIGEGLGQLREADNSAPTQEQLRTARDRILRSLVADEPPEHEVEDDDAADEDGDQDGDEDGED